MKLLRGIDSKRSGKGWIVAVLFLLALGLLGGSSRPDAVQTVALRSIAALFLIPVLYYFSFERLRIIRTPVLLLIFLGLWMAIQIIPLPPALWQSLPGMEPVIALSGTLGVSDVWRPISLVPFRTLNALASLIVPAIAILLPIVLGLRRSALLFAVVGISAACAMLGILQVMGGFDSPLYLYEYVNRGNPVGLFANRNHTAVMLSLSLVTITYLSLDTGKRALRASHKMALVCAFLIILTVVLISGSRAGLATTLIALAASGGLLLLRQRASAGTAKAHTRASWLSPRFATVSIIAVLLVLLLGALFATFGRLPALERMFESGPLDDLRWTVLPVLVEMMRTHFLLGSGFGSFEEVYHIYEPTALLLPAYLNMAHNDWAQLVIEGGIPAIVLLGVFLIWLIRSMKDMAGASRGGAERVLYWISVFLIVSLASFADYPLRAPLFQGVIMLLIAAYCLEIASLRRMRANEH